MTNQYILIVAALCCALLAAAAALICGALRKRAGVIAGSAVSAALIVLALVLLPAQSESSPPEITPDALSAAYGELDRLEPDGCAVLNFWLDFHAGRFQNFSFSTECWADGNEREKTWQINAEGTVFRSEGTREEELARERCIPRETLRAFLQELDASGWRRLLPLEGSWSLTLSYAGTADAVALSQTAYTWLLHDGTLTAAEDVSQDAQWYVFWMQSNERIIRILYAG